jgi:1-acyl-sn-glycerol-3-phosphate acyltransferases
MYKVFLIFKFVLYLMFKNICRIKLAYLRKEDQVAADKYAYKLARDIGNYAIKITRTKAEVTGEENIPEEPCVFVANHQGYFDAVLFVAFIKKGTGAVVKKQLKNIPLLGWIFKSVHTVFMDRDDIRDGIRAINEAAENINKGYSMTIFPEGTRSLSSQMGEFRKGSLKLALKANAPIVPVSLNGTYKIMEKSKKVTGNKVSVVFHEPIYVDKLSREENKNLSETVRSIIYNGVNSLLAKESGF